MGGGFEGGRPLGPQAEGRHEADARRDPVGELVADVDVRRGEDLADLVVRLLKIGHGHRALREDERAAQHDLRAVQKGQARGVVPDGRGIVGQCREGSAQGHCGGAVLINKETRAARRRRKSQERGHRQDGRPSFLHAILLAQSCSGNGLNGSNENAQSFLLSPWFNYYKKKGPLSRPDVAAAAGPAHWMKSTEGGMSAGTMVPKLSS